MSEPNEHKLHRDLTRAAQAASIKDSEIVREAFATLEAAYVERWRTSDVRDTVGREKLFLAVNVVRKVQDHFAKVVADGRLARRELDQLTVTHKRFTLLQRG